VLPRDLAEELHDVLRRFYVDDPSVTVVVERRLRERRGEPRRAGVPGLPGRERRRVRNDDGRRISARRAEAFPAASRGLPRAARRHAGRIVFLERLEPSSAHAEDVDTNRLVARVQSGDQEAFAKLYDRHFDRVFSYLRIALRDYHAAEDTTQQVFLRALAKIPVYEIQPGLPFRAWLLGIARYESLNYLRKHSWVDVITPAEVNRRIDEGVSEFDHSLLAVMSNSDLRGFLARMPAAQLQVLTLRYVMGFRFGEIASTMGRTPASIRQLHHRALVYLEQRMTAIGEAPARTRMSRSPVRVLVRQSTTLRTRRFLLTRSLGAPALSRRGFAYRASSRW
jgi:RNA polymerase sigma-70 factor (ECF subfamily)